MRAPSAATLLAALLALASGCRAAPAPPAGLRLVDLEGAEVDPLATGAPASVLVFVSSDCPISNRYAPELQRIQREFATRGVEFWLVYPNADETGETIRRHLEAYGHPGRPARDLHHTLVRATGVTVTPEAAVFDRAGRLVYVGRIDDRFVDFGKTRAAPTRHDLTDALEAILAGHAVEEPRTRAVGCFIPDLPPHGAPG